MWPIQMIGFCPLPRRWLLRTPKRARSFVNADASAPATPPIGPIPKRRRLSSIRVAIDELLERQLLRRVACEQVLVIGHALRALEIELEAARFLHMRIRAGDLDAARAKLCFPPHHVGVP